MALTPAEQLQIALNLAAELEASGAAGIVPMQIIGAMVGLYLERQPGSNANLAPLLQGIGLMAETIFQTARAGRNAAPVCPRHEPQVSAALALRDIAAAARGSD